MQRIGFSAYVIPQKSIPYHESGYVPYIFTDGELAALFTAADKMPVTLEAPFRKNQITLILKLLYGTGARIGELLSLKKSDVHTEKGMLFIQHAKLDKERLIPIASSLLEKLDIYTLEMNCYMIWHGTELLFPNNRGNPYNPNSFYPSFRRILWQAGISHGGRGKGPRVHDFRHTFAVHCLKKWIRDKKNLTTALPYLSVYMGHCGVRSTQYYLRLTAELYPEIISCLNTTYAWIIPEVSHEKDN
jgi:integrase